MAIDLDAETFTQDRICSRQTSSTNTASSNITHPRQTDSFRRSQFPGNSVYPIRRTQRWL